MAVNVLKCVFEKEQIIIIIYVARNLTQSTVPDSYAYTSEF